MKPECHFCHEPIDEEEICHGCHAYVCPDCDKIDPGAMGEHDVNDHLGDDAQEE